MPTSRSSRLAALGGVLGPAAFIGAWVAAAATTEREYSPVHDAISRLAASGADSQPLMTAGFVAFGVALPIYAIALRSALPGKAWVTAAGTGVATIGVALTPLDHSAVVDRLHAVFAGIGYITLAATPLLAARPLARAGHRVLSRLGLASGAVSAVSLILTTTGAPTGLFQRLGLTAGDVWIACTGIAIAVGTIAVREHSAPQPAH